LVSGITVTGNFLEQNNYGQKSSIAASCTIQVRFKAQTKGAQTGAVTVKDSAGGQPANTANRHQPVAKGDKRRPQECRVLQW